MDFVWIPRIPGARGRRGFGILWYRVAASGDRVWTLLEVWSDLWLDDFDDSMHRALRPGIMEAGSSDGDFHGFPWS